MKGMRCCFVIAALSLVICMSNKANGQSECGLQNGGFYSRTQSGWDHYSSSTLLSEHFQNVYNGSFEIGLPGSNGFSVTFTTSGNLESYLPSSGTSVLLSSDLSNPSANAIGTFAGEVAALKLNIDFNDAEIIRGGAVLAFGDLIFWNYSSLSSLNGMSIRQILVQANTLLGGGVSSYSISQLEPVLAGLNGSFNLGTPSQFALGHITGAFLGGHITYTQSTWGDENNKPFNEVWNNMYVGGFEVGLTANIGNSIIFTSADNLSNYLTSSGAPGELNNDLIDPSSSVGGTFSGNIIALKLNIDFADANKMPGAASAIYGNLMLHDLTTTTQLNGLRLREVLTLANTLLGGGSGIVEIADLDPVLADINAAFENGIASAFAQEHLKPGWANNAIVTHTQAEFGGDPATSKGAAILAARFDEVYFGYLEIGIVGNGGYSMAFSDVSYMLSYLPATGSPSSLDKDYLNVAENPSGQFGGEVTALLFNVSFNDKHLMGSTAYTRFGDLLLYNVSNSSLNGLKIREVLSIATSLLAGGTSSNFTIAEINSLLIEVNSSFAGGIPSQFAREHLKAAWGEMFTFTQSSFNDVSTIFTNSNYNNVFARTFGVVEIGLRGNAGYSMRFSSVTAIQNYLLAGGTPAPLAADLVNPTSSPSGIFGGNALALTLDIAFSDAGLMRAATDAPLGNLILQNFEGVLSSLNGLTIREFNELVNTALGGGSTPYTISDLNAIALELTAAFAGATPSQWAKEHIVFPCDNPNRCPVASSAKEIVPAGTATNIQLQALDEDSDDLTYTISQQPSHGNITLVNGVAAYIPDAAYYGADQFKFKASDGSCEAEATVDIDVVVCPNGSGYWKNQKDTWPVTSLFLGTVNYTKAQLLTILNSPVGMGSNADASLILANQLIAAKLTIANGAQPSVEVNDAINNADALIAGNTIPMSIKPKTALGKSMTSLAALLESYNKGSLTEGCSVEQPITKSNADEMPAAILSGLILEQNHPNPVNQATTIRYVLLPSENGWASYHVVLRLYDAMGREVRTLVNEMQEAGAKTVHFNAGGLASGVYFYRLTAGRFSEFRKMLKW